MMKYLHHITKYQPRISTTWAALYHKKTKITCHKKYKIKSIK